MKLGGYNEKATQRMNKVFSRISGSRVLMTLLALASLVLAAGANNKLIP